MLLQINRWFVLVLLVVSLIAVGCSAPEPELDQVSVRLGWQPNGEFAALLNAQAEGFYAEEGLEVDIRTGGSGIDPLPLVASGSEDFGVPASSGLVAAAIANSNMPVTAVATLMQMTPSGYMYILDEGEEPGQRTAADFAGRIVGTQPEGYIYVQTLAKMAGLEDGDYELAPVSWGPEPLLTNPQQVNYFNGWATNQAWILDQEGIPWGMVYISDYIPFFADVIVARNDLIEENPELVRRFVRATMRGLQFAIDNPEKTAENVIAYGMPGLETEKLMWRSGIQNPMSVSEDTKIHGLGYMNPERWTSSMKVMHEDFGTLNRLPEVSEVMTNEFLPGQ